MSVIATAVRHLMAAGVTGEALVQAIADMESAQPKDAAAEKRRAYDRERKRQAKANSTGIPPESTESAELQETAPLSLPPNENISNPPTHTPVNTQSRARKAHRMPSDWEPSLLTGDAVQIVDGWPPGAIDRELERFRDWAASASGPNALKTNWQAAWRNWIRRANDEGRVQNGRNQQQRPKANGGNNAAPDGRPMGRTEAAARAAAARLAGTGNAGGSDPSYCPQPDPVRAIRHVGG